MGNWPWTHPVEGGLGASQFSFSRTSISKQCKCIGFSRRRIGRGGRVNFDRAYAPLDVDGIDDVNLKGDQSSFFTDRVPPW